MSQTRSDEPLHQQVTSGEADLDAFRKRLTAWLAERDEVDAAAGVIDAGLIWIGPPPQAIRDLGDKVTARHIAERAEAPMAAGTKDPVKNADEVFFGIQPSSSTRKVCGGKPGAVQSCTRADSFVCPTPSSRIAP